MNRFVPTVRIAILVGAIAALLLAGCSPEVTGAPGTAPSTSTAAPSAAPPAASPPGATSATPTPPPGDEGDFTVRYGWAVPSQQVTVKHDVAVPPVPTLVEVRVGDHTADGFERVTFAFRGALPGYHFQLVRQVTQDGSGDPVRLPGNSFVQIVFNPAYAHDDAGHATVPVGLQRPGFRQLSGYQLAGDYEGYVTYGFGFSSSQPQIRVGERTRPDGTFVVAFDVRSAR
ncbi:AMIN-like domain-containing (lipo)protein [Dactylosporangium darangshiense]|uniref:AMIN-like domain-containing protein n=1 Tax=Dactylosporangium darangshiense TaxID=579108 RepID=A0ABP8CXB7_9ACTN